MSTVQTWTLWQRMPPRYQLTAKTIPDDVDELIAVGNSSDRSFTPRKFPSPRPTSSTGRQSAQNSSRPRSRTERRTSSKETTTGKTYDVILTLHDTDPIYSQREHVSNRENFMLSSNVSETEKNNMNDLVSNTKSAFSFPKRNSDYVSTFQKQCRVNSARRRLAEVPPTPIVPVSRSSQNGEENNGRAQTAPVFPVTSAEILKNRRHTSNDSARLLQEPKVSRQFLNARPKTFIEPNKIDMFHFDDTKSVSSSSSSPFTREFDNKQKKYHVQDTNRATVYIDNGKVMYFGKSRHDLTQLLKTQTLRANKASCFLAEIRRDYLKHPKYDRRRTTNLQKLFENDPRRIASERIDYNRRVEHILSYYDDPNIPQPPSRPTSPERIKSPKGARFKGLSLTPNVSPSRPPSRAGSPVPELYDVSSGDFILLNKQSRLHDRQFYLKTPGMHHGQTMAEIEKCRCTMCRMELQLALVSGAQADASLNENLGTDADCLHANDNTENNHEPCRNISKENSKHSFASSTKLSRSSSQRVSFKQPEAVNTVTNHDNKMTIKCKLPEMAVSESGFESSRTNDGLSTCLDENDDTT
ncbi:uncharacterized protein LOC128212188 isoform X2 [Mya arenaria]|nr:uncharacterized protein LOC128212188 isoform X2 [Mya arenaria]